MPRKIQSSYEKFSGNVLLGVGDSITHNNSYGTLVSEFWPEQLAVQLRAAGATVMGYNMGSSGRTTGQMLANIEYGLLHGAPAITGIYGGTNDPQYATTVQASPAPTSTVFTVGSGKGAAYQPGTYLTVDGSSALILSVATDEITLASALAGGAPAAGVAVAIDTVTNLTKIATWANEQGCTKFLVFGQHFYNFAASGDTVATPLAANTTLRTKHQAAVTAINALGGVTAAYVDLYDYMSTLITNGTEVDGTVFTAGDNGWHVLASNLHLNYLGERIMADAAMAVINEQSGWVAALTS